MLIDESGEKLGVIPVEEGIERAKEEGLDLVEVSPNTNPPVCKILNYGKFKFEQEKKAKEAKKNQQVIKLKEIRLQPKIDTHDYDFKLNHIKNFLSKGDKVKITIRFKGRQMAHTYLGEEVLNKFQEDLVDFAAIEKRPTMDGRSMSMIVAPKKK